jgi:tetratricopeptide (TPR) repeat protein
MPRAQAADIAHTALSDHRILRQPEKADSVSRMPRPGAVPMVNFFRDDPSVRASGSRDEGIALSHLTRTPGPLLGPMGRLALPLLEEAVRADPTDVNAWGALGWTRAVLGQGTEAMEAYRMALKEAPDHELILSLAAALAEQQGQQEEALGYLQRTVHLNPRIWEYRYRLSKLLAMQRAWTTALPEAEAALALNPTSQETQVLLISCCLQAGKKERAEKELKILLALHPDDERVLKDWYANQTR